MNGKEKCKVLKQIRKDIANANGISLEIPECTHKGDCLGTCPRCESEVRYLERAISEKRRRGIKVAVAGVSAGLIALSTTACEPLTTIVDHFSGRDIAGDMQVDTASLDGELAAQPDTEIALDGDIALLPDTDISENTGVGVAGFLQDDPDMFDETEVYEIAGGIPFAPDGPQDGDTK